MQQTATAEVKSEKKNCLPEAESFLLTCSIYSVMDLEGGKSTPKTVCRQVLEHNPSYTNGISSLEGCPQCVHSTTRRNGWC